jgi:hypothetical protein
MDTRRATEGPAGMLDSMSRSPTERNAVDMPGSDAAVESWREMRVKLWDLPERSPPPRRSTTLEPDADFLAWEATRRMFDGGD